jgi:predicted ATPase
VQTDGGGDRLRMLQTIGEYARERLDSSGEAHAVALGHAHRYAVLAREIRDGIEGGDQIGAVERGIAEEPNLQAALETLLAAAKNGDTAACEAGMQLSGDLYFYWHIRGKNISAREYAAAFLDADAVRVHEALERLARLPDVVDGVRQSRLPGLARHAWEARSRRPS